MKIPITKPYFTKAEENAVADIIRSGWVVQGPKVKEFEERFAKFTGAEYALATTSCTTALHMSLVALGIGRGDEVLVPAFTFAATANVVEQVGAKPVFVDIDLKTFNIDSQKIEKEITKKTKAIIPVHLFGLAAALEPIMKIARKHRLFVVEDAACGLGSFYNGKHVGTFGNTGCFSFHPRKAITCGEGGMVITNPKKLAEKLSSLRDHGAIVSDLARHKKNIFALPDHQFAGFNYRMTDIQGAVGVEQMKKLSFVLRQRKKRAETYNKMFKDHPYLSIPFVSKDCEHSYQSYVLMVRRESPIPRDRLAQKLISLGVSVRPGTQSVPHLSYYRKKYGYKFSDFPNSFQAEKQTITLPLFATMKVSEQKFVIKSFNP